LATASGDLALLQPAAMTTARAIVDIANVRTSVPS
jgi:hypothetical protein